MAIVSQTPSISEVKLALAETANSVGGLCTSPKIKKWSRWKPISMAKMGNITENDLKTANFGLIPPTPSNNYETIVNTRWGYQKPTGGASSPYRLGDFRNYNSVASSIAEVEGDITINKSNITKRPFTLMANVSGSDLLIGLNDFIGVIGSYYYGVVFKRGGDTYVKTANKTLAEGGLEFEVFMNEPPFTLLGDIEAYHLLISGKVENMTSLNSVAQLSFLPIPSEGNNIQIIKQKSGADFAMNFKAIGTSPSLTNNDINQYMGIDSPAFVTAGNLYLKVEFDNQEPNDRNFASTNLNIKVNPNYFGTTSYTAQAGLYNASGSPISSIIIPAGQKRTVIIGADSVVNRDGSNIATPPPMTEIYSTVQVNRGSDRIGSTSLKLKSS